MVFSYGTRQVHLGNKRTGSIAWNGPGLTSVCKWAYMEIILAKIRIK
jgi:hypothetical protein